MIQVLAVFVKAKVLINEETDQYDLNPSAWQRHDACVIQTDVFSTWLQVEKVRVNLNQPIKAEE